MSQHAHDDNPSLTTRRTDRLIMPSELINSRADGRPHIVFRRSRRRALDAL